MPTKLIWRKLPNSWRTWKWILHIRSQLKLKSKSVSDELFQQIQFPSEDLHSPLYLFSVLQLQILGPKNQTLTLLKFTWPVKNLTFNHKISMKSKSHTMEKQNRTVTNASNSQPFYVQGFYCLGAYVICPIAFFRCENFLVKWGQIFGTKGVLDITREITDFTWAIYTWISLLTLEFSRNKGKPEMPPSHFLLIKDIHIQHHKGFQYVHQQPPQLQLKKMKYMH